MPNLVALVQVQGAISLLSVPFVDVLITVHYYLLPLGSAFYVNRLTKTGDDFFLPASSR